VGEHAETWTPNNPAANAASNVTVRQNVKYKLPNSRGPRPGHPFYWLLALALAAFLGWLWWNSGKTTTPPAKTTTVIAAKPVAPTPTHREPTLATPVSPANPPTALNQYPRPVQNPFEAQVALVSLGISPGSLDGALGSQTRAAIAAFQKNEGLPVTGALDPLTRTNLLLDESPYTTYTVTTNDLARLQPLATTWLGKSQQTALDYETILELVAERTYSHPSLIRRLNPAINWTNLPAGTVLSVPKVSYPDDPAKAAWVTIHLNSKVLEAFDAQTNLLAHFPCSIAKRVEKRPVGLLHVVVVAPHPNYTFDPDVFPESAEAKQLGRKLVLPPGPNNPVGVAWIGLDRPGYGIHGTPAPEAVGRTESHGCFRLANWNAEYLLRLITIGTPVYVVE
jgi:lipoprotein-anchoring transpeptidase ErfK/SrfK